MSCSFLTDWRRRYRPEEMDAPRAPPLPYNPTSREIRRERDSEPTGLRSLRRLLAALPRSRLLAQEERRLAATDAGSLGLPDSLFLQPSSARARSPSPLPARSPSPSPSPSPLPARSPSPSPSPSPPPARSPSPAGLDALRGEAGRVHLVCLGRAPSAPSRAGKRSPRTPARAGVKEERASRGRDANARYRRKEGIVWVDAAPRGEDRP